MTENKQITKKDLILLKPPTTPIQLEGDSNRGLKPVTYHSQYGILQQAPQISLKNQCVLEEDEYIQALSHIIKRDFFPCLDQFQKFKKLLSPQIHSTSSSIPSSPTLTNHITNSEFNLHQKETNNWEHGASNPSILPTSTPGMTPLGLNSFSDTPHSTYNSNHLINPITCNQSQTNEKSYDPSLSLDQFCSRYTSEDNSSFSEILNNANRLKRIKYSWAFNSSSKHNNRLLESTLKREHLIGMIGTMAQGGHRVGLVEGIPGKPGERKIVGNVITKQERQLIEASDQQSKFMITQADEQTKGNHQESQINKPSGTSNIDLVTNRHHQSIKNPDSWPHVTKNALMFGPDANTSDYQTRKLPPFPAKPTVLPGGPKSINYASTRMINDKLLERNLLKSKSTNMTSRHSESTLSPTTSQIAAIINSETSSSTPKVNGFSFVPELPTPNPEKLKENSELDKLMTWGEIVSTPLRVDNDKNNLEEEELIERGRFKICKTPKREQLAISMARKASKSLRQKFGYSSGLSKSNNNNKNKLRKSLLGDQNSPNRFNQTPNSSISDKNQHFNKTPKRDDFLSPAAKILLKKTSCSSFTPTHNKLFNSSSSTINLITPSKRKLSH